MQQAGYLAALEIFVGLYCGACRVIGELTLSLVGTAGQVTAVADGGLSALVLAYDGAHRPGAATRDSAGVVAVADVDFLVVAVAQYAAHVAAAAHRHAALVGAVLDGAGADVAHHAGHAVGVRRTGNVAGVEAAFHRGFRVFHHGAYHAADVALAGGDGDVHPAGHAADGAPKQPTAPPTFRLVAVVLTVMLPVTVKSRTVPVTAPNRPE